MIISWIKEVSKRPVDGTNNIPDVCLIEVKNNNNNNNNNSKKKSSSSHITTMIFFPLF